MRISNLISVDSRNPKNFIHATGFRWRSSVSRAMCAIMMMGSFGCLSLPGQDDPRARELEALRARVQALEAALQDVRGKLAEMEQTNRTGSNTPAADRQTAVPPSAMTGSNYMIIGGKRIELPATVSPFDPKDRSPVQDYNTFADQQQASPRPDNKPVDPALKGFLPVPGTDTMIRFGGSVRLDTICDFQNSGNPNQFVPSSIPVDGQDGAGGGERSTMQTKGTRVSFEARRPVGDEGRLRIYYENDFYNDSSSSSMSYRVRHFYGQAWNLMVGQTFTTFMDIDAWPDVVDYAGPNAAINRRQAQIRYSPPIYDGVGKMNLLFSLEQPNSEIDTSAPGMPDGAKSMTRTPDGVAGWRWEGDAGHVQLAGLFRDIGYESGSASSQHVFGWGSSASGALKLFKNDKFSWQVAYGEGMARYVNDLSGASPNLDAGLDGSGNLEAIPVFASMAGYTHQWSKQFRSTVGFGYIDVNPTDSLGDYAIEKTRYASCNLLWQPTTSFRMGLEYLFGSKETQNGADGDAHRLNFVIRYDLIR